jgi:hypothetical protein
VPGGTPGSDPERDEHARPDGLEDQERRRAGRKQGSEAERRGDRPGIETDLDASDQWQRGTSTVKRTAADDKRRRRAGDHRQQRHRQQETKQGRHAHGAQSRILPCPTAAGPPGGSSKFSLHGVTSPLVGLDGQLDFNCRIPV